MLSRLSSMISAVFIRHLPFFRLARNARESPHLLRHSQCKRTPISFPALNRDIAVQDVSDNFSGKIQPQAGAAGLDPQVGLEPLERLEKFRHVLLGDAYPGIAHRYPYVSVRFSSGNRDGS